MRFALAALLAAAALALPTAASAQAPPPDEHAAAQAFADAAKRFEAAATVKDEPDSAWIDACERELDRVPAKHQDEALALVLAHGLRLMFAQLRAPLGAFRTELANVATADPVLISGRAAIRQMGRRIDALPAPGRFCRDLRAWRRAGYPRSAPRAAEAELKLAIGAISPGILRKLHETALHLRELGVSKRDAAAFGGDAGW